MKQLNKQNKTLKIRCPCCDEEIILELKVLKVVYTNKKKSKKLDIEFGEQREGEKELNEWYFSI